MKLTEEVKFALSRQRPIPVAVCDPSSKSGNNPIPNLVYISFIKAYDDETILIADNKMYKTIEILKRNPEIAITVYHARTNQSYQIKGIATLFSSGDLYEETVAWVKTRKPNITPRHAILVKVRDIYNKDKKLILTDSGNYEFVKGVK